MGDVFAEESFKLWGDWGARERENRGIFSRRMPLFWGEFGGIEGENGVPCTEEIPLKGTESGSCGGGRTGENRNKKRPQQRIAAALLGAIIQKILCSPYFRRHHSIFEKFVALAI